MPLFFKFQSFNVFGAGVEDLSTSMAYPYTPNGSGALGPVTQALLVGANLDFGNVNTSATETDDWGSASVAPVAEIDLGGVTN